MFLLLNSVICALAVYSGIFTEAENRGDFYVQSPLFNFLMAPRRVISSKDAKLIFTGEDNFCSCRNRCFVTGCKSWSFEILNNGTTDCRLSQRGPSNTSLEEALESTYFFKEDNVCSLSMLITGAVNVNKNLTYPESMLEDVALEKLAYQNTTFHSTYSILLTANLTNDGNETTFGHTHNVTNPWWMVDLGEEKTIFHIKILPRLHACCADRFRKAVLVIGDQETSDPSVDQTYRILGVYEGPYSNQTGRLLYTCDGIKGRYLAIWLNTTEFLHLSSVEVLALKKEYMTPLWE